MLKIVIGGKEVFDEELNTFFYEGGTPLQLEHSLVSLSKWESKFEKPFISKDDKSEEETFAYIEFMTLTSEIPPGVFQKLSKEHIDTITDYIDAKMTATWFEEPRTAPRSREVITAEVIYYWMIAFSIPMECENWHLNRLFTLIKVCNAMTSKPEKMSRSAIASRNRALNAQRKAQLGTKG